MIVVLLLYCIGILYLTQAIVYLFQIKEYRMDRMSSQLREDGVIALIKKYIGKRAAITARNLLILAVQIGLLGFTLMGAQSTIEQIILIPIVGVLSPVVGVFITEPLARMRRKRLITEARTKVAASHVTFIGISGSYGKTTTKEYLAHVLGQKFSVAKTDKYMNTDVGVAISILKNLQPTTELFIAEVGAYRLGEVQDAVSIFNPRYAIMVPFGNQHLDLYGSREHLIHAESEILAFIPKDGKVYANADIPEFEYIASKTAGSLVSCSLQNKKADIYAQHINATEKGSSAQIFYKKASFTITTPLLGIHVIQNLLPVIALALDFGMSQNEVIRAVATLPAMPGKLSLHTHQGAIVLNDSGNSNLNGFLAAIDTMKLFTGKKKYLALSKGIIELGPEKQSSYQTIISHLKRNNVTLITTDNLFKTLVNDDTVMACSQEEELYTHVQPFLNAETVILLEGRFSPAFVAKFIDNTV